MRSGPNSAGSAIGAMLWFHLGAGVRLSLRALAPLLAAGVAVVGLEENPAALVQRAGLGLFGPAANPAVRAAFLLLTLTIASWAAPRLTRGLHGWLRHLPVDGASHRRAAAMALMIAQTPATLAGLILLLAAGVMDGAMPASRQAAGAAGLVMLSAGAALASLPVAGGALPRLFALIAAACGLSSSWVLLPLGVALLGVADRLSGPLRFAPTRLALPAARASAWAGRGGVVRAHVMIAWRASGWLVLGPLTVSLLLTAAGYVMAANNGLQHPAAGRAARLAGGLAITFLLSGLADMLALRRPAWPWARSLPLSSRSRILIDAGMMFAASLVPALLVIGIDPWAPLACLPVAALLSVRAAGTMRAAAGTRAGAGSRIFVEGFALAGLACLLPATALLMLAALEPALRMAARHERRLKVTRWMELRQQAAGDPLSEGGR